MLARSRKLATRRSWKRRHEERPFASRRRREERPFASRRKLGGEWKRLPGALRNSGTLSGLRYGWGKDGDPFWASVPASIRPALAVFIGNRVLSFRVPKSVPC